ncbi:FecR family protein [Parapedobacter sp. GCM10030251]|uniref:FecR family protein n=1 Tax=Parapedobacter sp. GCM10030251 TaxID=3273419 RepID=UPI00361F3014
MENRKAIVSLLTAYLNKQVSREEFDRLFSALAKLEDEDFKATILQAVDDEPDEIDVDFIQARVSHLYPQIQAKIQVKLSQKKGQIWWRVSAAAALVLAFLSIGLYVIQTQPYQGESTIALTPERVLPGGNRATLTLANGRSIDLSTRKSGIVVGNGITYLDGSTVFDGRENTEMSSLQLTTPNGGQYQITLSDGTRVMLNAASTLTYPIKFSDKNTREVTLEGEAYFEVAKDPEKPFIVTTAKQRIEVLGTSFNINAYSNETVTKTTVLTGSVRINTSGKQPKGVSRMLTPNQQGIVNDNQNEIIVKDVNPESAIAWKNGLFNFHGLSIDESLKQVERWYNIRIVYEGEIPQGYLGGKMSRGVKLATFLNFLAKDFHIKSEMKSDRTLILYGVSKETP